MLNVLDASLDVDDLNVLELLAFGLVGLLEGCKLAGDHGVLHVVALPGTDAREQRLHVGAEVDKVDVGIWVLVVQPGGADDVAVLFLERAAGNDDATRAVVESGEGLVAQQDEPIPAIFVVEGNAGGHLVNVCFWVELITLNVVEAISIRQMLGNGALAAACRAGDNEDVVVGGDGHLSSLCVGEGGR